MGETEATSGEHKPPEGNLLGIAVKGLHPSLPTIVWFRCRTAKAEGQLLTDLEGDSPMRIWVSHGLIPMIFQCICQVSRELPTHVFPIFQNGEPLGDAEVYGNQSGEEEDMKKHLSDYVATLSDMYQITEKDAAGTEELVELPWFAAVRLSIGDKIYG